MKLFFDARYIRTDYHDGISRYTTELGCALAAQTSVTFLISSEGQRALLPPGAICLTIHDPTSWKEPLTALILNKHKPDVVASPLQTIGSIGRRFKLILNQQDLTYYKFAAPPPQFSPLVRAGWWLYHRTYVPGRITLNAADIVATVSETSKQEIIAVNLTKRPVIAVPNAARDLSAHLKQPFKLLATPPKNLVYMGAFIAYKNVETLIATMEFLPGRTLHLLSRISVSRKAELMQLAPKGVRIIFHNGVSDEQYAELLADDAIMVSASKSEGYGLPLAEALKLGVPAVVSDIAPFHEVAGHGALFAAANDPKQFAQQISSLDSIAERQKLTDLGKKHINSFSWDKSAKVLLEACNRLTG